MSSRDTQFKNFADMVWDELINHWNDDNECKAILARRAYGLVAYACDQINLHQTCQNVRLTSEGMVRHVPDMPELSQMEDER